MGTPDEIREIVKHINNHEGRITNLEEFRRQQNASLVRIEEKIDDLIKWFMTASITVLGGFVLGVLAWLVQRG